MKNDIPKVASWLLDLASKFGVSQKFGNYNPAIERFSGGVNTGTDIRTPVGTPINLPKGNWRVLEAYSGAKGGYVGNAQNRGYGNSVMVQNLDTGERYRFSHLSQPTVKPGQVIPGGLIGLTGATGNVTGAHLDLEYYDPRGRLSDVFRSSLASTPDNGIGLAISQPIKDGKPNIPKMYQEQAQALPQQPSALSSMPYDTGEPMINPTTPLSTRPIPKPQISQYV